MKTPFFSPLQPEGGNSGRFSRLPPIRQVPSSRFCRNKVESLLGFLWGPWAPRPQHPMPKHRVKKARPSFTLDSGAQKRGERSAASFLILVANFPGLEKVFGCVCGGQAPSPWRPAPSPWGPGPKLLGRMVTGKPWPSPTLSSTSVVIHGKLSSRIEHSQTQGESSPAFFHPWF